MEVIRQYNHCVDRERMTLAGFTKGRAQSFDMFRQQPQPTIGEVDRKEEATARDEIATVCGHKSLA
jgi:hypothetical protein